MNADESRLEILKQVEAGVLTPAEGAGLLAILEGDLNEPEEHPEPQVIAPPDDKEEEPKVPWYWKAVWSLFLWLGVGLTVLSAYWMYQGYVKAGAGFGFFLSWIPFLLGIALTYGGARLIQSHWIHVAVNTSDHEKPMNIKISLPLPLGLASWVFKNFGRYMPSDVREMRLDEMINKLEDAIKKGDPFLVHVNDDENGDQVDVVIA